MFTYPGRTALRRRASGGAFATILAAALAIGFLYAGPARADWCFPYPKRVASVPIAGVARTIAISGNTACIAVDGGALVVVDISVPTAPQVESTYPLPGHAYDVSLEGSLAYVVHDGDGGAMWIVDVSTPSAPAFVDSLITPGVPKGIDVQGNFAYVADTYLGGLLVVYLGATHPFIVGQNHDWPIVTDVEVRGTYAFVANLVPGMVVYDVSNPIDPQYRNSLPVIEGAERISVSNGIAYVGNALGPLDLVDISNPLSPVYMSRIRGVGQAIAPGAAAIDANRVLRAGDIFAELDVTDPSTPGIVSSESNNARAVAVDGDYAFVCTPAELLVYDISSPVGRPDEAVLPLAGEHRAVAMQERYAYVASGTAGLHVVDIVDPADPKLVTTLDTPGQARDVAASGGLAYIADYSTGGLEVVDISDPATPAILGAVHTLGTCQAVDVSGPYAYVAEGHYGLTVVDVSTPAAPVVVGNVNTAGTSKEATGVVAAPPYVYYTDFYQGLQVVDVSTPSAPAILDVEAPLGNASDVALSGGVAFLANSGGGFSTIDASTPGSLLLLSTIDPSPGYAQRLCVSGSHAFVTWSAFGLEVIDISDPGAPVSDGIFWGADNLRDVAVDGDVTCALWESRGLTVMTTPCEAIGSSAGDAPAVAATRILDVVPNPFNPSTSIRFEVASTGSVSLEVFSVTGALVSTLVPRGTTMTTGVHAATWDGTDNDGRAVASGTYFARLESRSGVATRRLTLLK